jgi:undecaprenyl pyrophosphate phosphatase UppP
MILGVAIAAVVGYLSMIALNRLLASNRLWWFGPYCLLAGLVTVIVAR